MKPCTEFRESLTLLAAQALDAAEKVRTEHHLESCRACRSYFENLQRLCGRLESVAQSVAASELPSHFHPRLVGRIRSDVEGASAVSDASPASFLSGLRRWFAWRRVAYAGAIALVLVLAMLSMEREAVLRNARSNIASGALPVREVAPPAPTLMALSRALHDSEAALDALLARQEQLLAANDPPSMAMSSFGAR